MAAYYITTTEYVGPNKRDSHGQHYRELLYITTEAPRTNLSREVRTEGWLGTTDDWAWYAHGAYATLDAARAAVQERWQTYSLDDEEREYALQADAVEVYGVGAYDPREAWDAADWLAGDIHGVQADIRKDATDEGLDRLAAEYESQALANGIRVEGVRKELERIRDGMEIEEDAE